MFLPAWAWPLKNSTALCSANTATMPDVLIALATGLRPEASARDRAAIRLSTFMGVSSLCNSGACAACTINAW